MEKLNLEGHEVKIHNNVDANYPPEWVEYREMAAMSFHFKMSWKDILDMPMDMYYAYMHWLSDYINNGKGG